MKQAENRILLILCTLLLGTAFMFSCRDKQSTSLPAAEKKELWTCSMHPEIIRDRPGNCPICGMELVKKVEHAAGINDIQLDDLLQPTDRFVISSIPVTVMERNSELIEVNALGEVAYDSRLVNTISARVSGRIEKLYLKYRYQPVTRGQRILDLYSPELLTAQQELLFLIKNDPSNASLIDAARKKLLLLGVSESQLQRIMATGKPSLTVTVYSNFSGHIHEAGNTMPGSSGQEQRMGGSPPGGDIARITEELSVKEGMYVQKGQNIFQVYDVSRSWVLLNIFPEYLGFIKTGDAVLIIPETAPSSQFRAKIDFIEPVYRKENKTTSARVYFNNSRLRIPIGSQVRSTIFVNTKEANWLPRDAVLSLGINKVAFVKVPGGFKAQKVETGLSYNNRVQIVSGLNPSDSVAANAQYLTDSESFIKANDQP